jgi:hypothetical protein
MPSPGKRAGAEGKEKEKTKGVGRGAKKDVEVDV